MNHLKDNVHYTWERQHEHAFKSIKQAIIRPCNIQYFNHKADMGIQYVASMKGLDAYMMKNGQPVSYASKSLTDTESRYSNMEREMLGVVFALTRFHKHTLYWKNESFLNIVIESAPSIFRDSSFHKLAIEVLKRRVSNRMDLFPIWHKWCKCSRS